MTAARTRSGEFRYGAVFALTLTNVLWQILAPSAAWSRSAAVALDIATLMVIVVTSRARPTLRRARALVAAALGVAAVTAVATDSLPQWLVLSGDALLSLAIPLALCGGLIRLVRSRGVTLQAVAGALSIYLLIGLAFAAAIGVLGRLESAPYFTNGAAADESNRVYYSFTVLTTTGFGDLTAATRAGHALSVAEMLTGQIYLVTVIGVLVGSFGRRS